MDKVKKKKEQNNLIKKIKKLDKEKNLSELMFITIAAAIMEKFQISKEEAIELIDISIVEEITYRSNDI